MTSTHNVRGTVKAALTQLLTSFADKLQSADTKGVRQEILSSPCFLCWLWKSSVFSVFHLSNLILGNFIMFKSVQCVYSSFENWKRFNI